MTKHSNVRFNQLTGRSIIIAPNRESRPSDFSLMQALSQSQDCPFCLGNEHATPPPIQEYFDRQENRNSQWTVRVVPNKYPAVHTPHELVIESCRHVASFSQLNEVERTFALTAYRDRYKSLQQNEELKHIQIFKNVGRDGGASVEHTHSQIIALDFVPTLVGEMKRRAKAFQDSERDDLVHSMVSRDKQEGRLVFESSLFAIACPFASRFSYECWVVPHTSCFPFHQTDQATLAAMAEALARVVAAYERLLESPAYNMVLHAPPIGESPPAFGWFFRVFPRVTQFAGFEWATDCYINTVSPEQAAMELQQVFV